MNVRTRSLDEYISGDGDTSLQDMLASDERVDQLAGGSEYQRELHKELDAALSILDRKNSTDDPLCILPGKWLCQDCPDIRMQQAGG